MAHLKIDTGIFKYNIFAMIQNVCHMSLYSVTNNLCHISCTTFLFSLISSNNFKLLLKLLLGHCTKLVKIKVPQKLILNLLLRTRSSYGNWVHSTFNLFTNTNWCMTLDIGIFVDTVHWLCMYTFTEWPWWTWYTISSPWCDRCHSIKGTTLNYAICYDIIISWEIDC